jgi:branched-chain amino acid transport system ATP-binding protein
VTAGQSEREHSHETDTALELCGISAGYGSVPVLRNISITVRSGAIEALLGPNGAGKTTLLRVAAGLIRASEGTIRLRGSDVTRMSTNRRARAGLCLIPEGRGIFRSLTVRENLTLQTPPRHQETRLDLALDAFPALRDRLRVRAGVLSGGQQQMLSLARCYLSSPSLVLLDEVSMGLGPAVVDEIFDSLANLASRGTSVLLVEQYVSRALKLAETVHLLRKGSIDFSGPAENISEDDVARGYLSARQANSDSK